MTRSQIIWGLTVAWVAAGTGAWAFDKDGSAILSVAADRDQVASTPWPATPLERVSCCEAPRAPRFYMSGMIGPSFATFDNPDQAGFSSEDTLFAAGGAVGLAFDRRRGVLRLELEGTGRDTYLAPFNAPGRAGEFTILANNWSVMTNLWREISITDRFGVYGGGGIGAGGYLLGERDAALTDYAPPAGNFAWQFGGGLVWDVTERLTFDIGYRYFHIDTIRQANVLPNQFASSELMFTLRLYEPFRAWRR